MASTHALPQWIDPDQNPPTKGARARVVREVISEPSEIDRYHNHESLSPEALTQALGDLQASMEALEERVNAVEEGAASVVGAAKGLGLSMLQMGDALAKRVQTLEEVAAAPPTVIHIPAPEPVAEPAPEPVLFAPIATQAPKGQILRLTLGLGAAFLVTVAAVVMLHPNTSPPPGAPPAQVLYSPSTPAPGN
jgi:hypothetical protein